MTHLIDLAYLNYLGPIVADYSGDKNIINNLKCMLHEQPLGSYVDNPNQAQDMTKVWLRLLVLDKTGLFGDDLDYYIEDTYHDWLRDMFKPRFREVSDNLLVKYFHVSNISEPYCRKTCKVKLDDSSKVLTSEIVMCAYILGKMVNIIDDDDDSSIFNWWRP